MGLIKAILGAAGGVMADQWKEYFYCDSLNAEVLAVKGQKRVSGRSSNNKGSDNIISNGSVIAIAEGQCMMIVEQGKVVDICAEPGEYVYDTSSEPSLFFGDLEEGIRQLFSNIGKRFTFGGEPPKDQRVYYFNTKELIGNKYGTPSPVPFRVVDERAGLDVDIAIKCFGEYSYKLVNPLAFYTNVCGNVSQPYTRSELEGQLKSELLTALQPAFARISAMGIRYSALPAHTTELAEALKDILSEQWKETRGIEIASIGVSSVKASEEDEQMIKDMQRNAAFMDPIRAAAHIAGAQGDALKTAAANEGGAAGAFMGVGMVGNIAGAQTQNLYQVGAQMNAAQAAAQPAEAAPAAETWKCEKCGSVVSGKFCPECGAKRPEKEGWVCSCGTVNKGKFCTECGAKKPLGVPQYRCDKCGWEPEDPTKPPKFCPECGDPFDEGDII